MIFGIKTKKEREEEATVELEEAEKIEKAELVRLERDVYASLRYFRLLADLKTIEDKMERNRPLDIESSAFLGKFRQGFADNVTNRIRREEVNRLSAKRQAVRDRILGFEKENDSADVTYSYGKNKEAMKDAIEKLFANDENGEARILFGLRFALDKSLTLEEENASLETVSELLYGKKNKLEDLVSELKNDYLAIASNPFSGNFGTGLLVGLGAMTVLSAVATPVIFAAGATSMLLDVSCAAIYGAWTPIFTATGMTAVTGAAVLASIGILGAAALGEGAVRVFRDDATKAVLRSLDTNDFATLLAVKATLAREARRSQTEEKFKILMDGYLRVADDLRSDSEYVWIIERTDGKRAKEKVNLCSHFTERMATIVGI